MTENTEQRSKQQHSKATNPRATDWKKRGSWPTGSDGCVKLTWNADVLPQPGNWSQLYGTMPCPLTVALSLLKPWLRTHRNLTRLLTLCYPCFVGQDRLEHASIKRMRLPRNAGGFDVSSPVHRWPFLEQCLALAPSGSKSTGLQAMRTLGLLEAANNGQGKLQRIGLTMDERAMPRATDSPSRELDAAHVGARPLRKRQTSWKRPLAEAATRSNLS